MGGKLALEVMLLILRVKNWFSLLPESGRDVTAGTICLSLCTSVGFYLKRGFHHSCLLLPKWDIQDK
jgi:hypothetical protein